MYLDFRVFRIQETGIPMPHSSVALFKLLVSWSLAKATHRGVTSRDHWALPSDPKLLGYFFTLMMVPFLCSLVYTPDSFNDKGLCCEFPTPSSRVDDDSAMGDINFGQCLFSSVCNLSAVFHLPGLCGRNTIIMPVLTR